LQHNNIPFTDLQLDINLWSAFMAHLSVTLLGPPLVTLNRKPGSGFDSDKVRGLLAYLIVESDRPHRREKLAGLLWPEYPERSARTSLRSALANLRQVIDDHSADPPFLHITRQTIQFNKISDYSLDVNNFLSLVSTEASQSADLTSLEEAVTLYKGAFMEGFSIPDSVSFEDWLLMNRELMQGQVLRALHRLAGYHQEKGSHQEALRFARQQLELDFYQEAAHQQVMWSLTQSGQRNEALVQYERLREVLEDELGVKPLESTQAMYEQLLNSEIPSPPLAIITCRRESLEVGECPYRGLAAFREQDASHFFGREGFTAKISEALRKRSLVTVIVGSSGSGKSSTIFAGLVPKLHVQGDLLIVHLRPRSNPFLSLAGAFLPLLEPNLSETDQMLEIQRMADSLREGYLSLQQVVIRTLEIFPDKERMLLIIDQFEELYTLCPEPEVRQRFLDEILETIEYGTEPRTSPFMLLLIMRADFMGQALTHRSFADALQDNTIILSPMNRAELRAAIEKPAEQQGAAFESGLVARILDDVGEEPGNLPLLEFALALLWERLDQGWATHAAYEDIGRVEGALARYADEIYVELADKDQEMARQVFIQLVQPGQGTEDTRRVAIRTELDAERWSLIQYLADKRLVVTGRDESGHETVELVHEALIGEWQWLREWLEEDRSFRTWQESLRVALRQWEGSDRDDGALLRGAPLTQAETWRAERADSLSTTENEFIQISLELHKQEQGRREQRRRRTIFGLAAGLVIALILVLLIGLQWSRAEDASSLAHAGQATAHANAEARATHQAIAEEQSRIATSRELAAAALANLELDPQRSLLLALQSVNETYQIDRLVLPEAENSLHQSINAIIPHQVLQGEEDWMYTVVYYPDGTRLVTWGFTEFPGINRVWDAATGELLFTIPGYPGNVSSDGTLITSMRLDFEAGEEVTDIWNAVTGELVSNVSIPLPPDMVELEIYDQGFRYVARVLGNGVTEVWDLNTQENILTIGNENRLRDSALDFTPDGKRLVTGNMDGSITIWDLANRKELITIYGHSNPVGAISFNHNGSLLATAGGGNTVKIWDVESGEELLTLTGHKNEVRAIDFSPSGTLLATAGYDHLIKIWDVEHSLYNHTGKELLTLVGHQLLVTNLDFNPDETHLASVSEDGSSRIWDITPGSNSEGGVMFNGEGPGPSYSVSLSIDRDGTRLAAANSDHEPKIWDLTTGHLMHTLSGHADRVEVIEFSPDGKNIITASHDKTINIWDAARGKILSTLPDIKCGYVDIAFCDLTLSPDGQFLAVGDYDGIIKILEFQTLLNSNKDTAELDGVVIQAFEGKIMGIAFSPDGTQLAAGSFLEDTAKIWDSESGEQILTLTGHEGPVYGIIYSPDGERLATTSADATARIWEGDTGNRLFTLTGHTASVFRASFSPDGSLIATASYDGTAKLWDAETGTELTTLYGHNSGVADVAFSPDGKKLYTASVDGTNRVYLLDIKELIALARSRLTRGFFEEECQRFLHLDKCPEEP
jgi:WD40 repeat protein/DNA-binding SARP family transcriptional activator